jgi:hypothetical protein
MSRRYDRTDIAKVGVWSALVALAGAVGYIVSVVRAENLVHVTRPGDIR